MTGQTRWMTYQTHCRCSLTGKNCYPKVTRVTPTWPGFLPECQRGQLTYSDPRASSGPRGVNSRSLANLRVPPHRTLSVVNQVVDRTMPPIEDMPPLSRMAYLERPSTSTSRVAHKAPSPPSQATRSPTNPQPVPQSLRRLQAFVNLHENAPPKHPKRCFLFFQDGSKRKLYPSEAKALL